MEHVSKPYEKSILSFDNSIETVRVPTDWASLGFTAFIHILLFLNSRVEVPTLNSFEMCI
ncbi:hypothetical protein BWD14_15605 [Leptospira santarosai]|uniref:Uncharacterized protein n=1 Tax=Leptospira santarosai TaxID=28183 RepID=A0AB73MDV2_9LEPT|nr:hypothetical protein BWD14_15605 [Leptospira santarosai]